MADPLLTMAGRSFTTSFTGGAIVQLDSSGTWKELATGNTVFWNLREFTKSDVITLWHIRADGFASNDQPDRGKIFRSADQGATWTDVTPNASGNGEFATDIIQDADDNLWLITDERATIDTITSPNEEKSRVYKSTDDGVTWTVQLTVTDFDVAAPNERFYPLFNIAAHPTDADLIIVEGTRTINNEVRLWKTTDGGSTWSSPFLPTHDTGPSQLNNAGSIRQSVFFYTAAGDLMYAGIMESANDTLFIMKSTDDGTSFTTNHEEADSLGYGAAFFESGLVYFSHANDLFEVVLDTETEATKIADHGDSPFTTDHDFHGISRYDVSSVAQLHLGCNVGTPSSVVTEDPSVFTRPADLSSGWVEHTDFSDMDTDLNYRLYVARKGLVGATAVVPDVVRPPPPDEPPGGGGPLGAEPGVGDPAIGEARRPKDRGLRGLRGRRGFKAGPIGHRLPPAEPGEPLPKSVPDEYEEPLVRKWLTFGWLTIPMLESFKTITLRDWGPTEGLWWQHGELFYAYDAPPVEGGRRLALLIVMQEPFVQFTPALKMADYHKLGYSYAMANQLTSPGGRTGLQVWEDLHSNPQRLWLLRFAVQRIFEQGRKEKDTVNVGIPMPIKGALGSL